MLGIDFSDNHIKVVQLKPFGKERFSLEAGGIGEMPIKALHSENQNDWLAIANALKKVLAEAKVTTKEAVFALPEASVFFTVLQIPQISQDKLKEVIALEARRYVPFPIKEVVLDWQILESSAETSPGGKKITVFLACALKKTVNQYRQIAELAGIDLKVLEVQALALQRSLIPEDYPEPVLILEWGDGRANLMIVEKGIPRLSRHLEWGSRFLDQDLAEVLKIDLKKARALKESSNLKDLVSANQSFQEIVQPRLDKLILNLKQVLRIFNDQSSRPVKVLLLSGGGVLLKGLPEYFQNALPEVKVHLADPWKWIEVAEKLKAKLQSTAPQFSVVVGLAKRN